MGKVEAADVKDKNFGNNFLYELKWLRTDRSIDTTRKSYDNERKSTAFHYAIEYIASKYDAAGNRAMAYCFGLTSGSFPYNGVLDSIVQLMNKKNHTPMESFALDILGKSKYDMVTMEAENLVYQYKFKEAVEIYQRENVVGADSTENTEADDYGGHWNSTSDPFVSQINDCFECGGSIPDSNELGEESPSLYEFAEEMISYQDSLKINPKNAAAYYYRLANGYYNMTYFGSCRGYFSDIGGQYTHVWFGRYEQPDTSIPNVLSCKMAEEYYVKAMNLAKNPEFKARCCFRAAKCEHNYFYTHFPKDFEGDFKSGKYFAMLKANYSKTQYYREIINECGYFKTYLGIQK
jgi:hypothetical protein